MILSASIFSTECRYRFSRAGRDVDTGVTTVYIENDGGLQLRFEATDDRLPIVLGTTEQDVSDCSISSLEQLSSDQSWVTITHTVFELIEEGGRTYVQVCMCDDQPHSVGRALHGGLACSLTGSGGSE